MKVTLHRFGRNRRLVLMLEWLTLWPTCGPLAVSSQRRDIFKNPLPSPALPKSALRAARGFKNHVHQGSGGRIGGKRRGVKVLAEGSFQQSRKMPSIHRFARILPQISLRNLRKLDC